jgi:hypothetical protein
MRVLLVNCSHPSYNLGMEKARNWWTRQGAEVWYAKTFEPLMATQYDAIWMSAIFSWDVLELVRLAQIALNAKVKVEVGGPGTFGAVQFIIKELALLPQYKPDPRFEREPGEYAYVFWSRGCPAKNCSLGYPRDGRPPVCSVPEMEGSRYTLYTDIEPARVIADNNLSALPRSHQELIVERTLAKEFKSVDANSGFEPHSMRPWVVDIWKRLPLVAWRFAYDELGEREKVLTTLKMLADAGIRPYRCHIYCLAGNEPLADCERRVQEINEWKAYPIVQRRRPLDWLSKTHPLPCLHDWTERKLIDFQRWGNRLAKGVKNFADYIPNLREA